MTKLYHQDGWLREADSQYSFQKNLRTILRELIISLLLVISISSEDEIFNYLKRRLPKNLN